MSQSSIMRSNFDAKNEINYMKCKMNASPSPQPSENSSAAPSSRGCQDSKRRKSSGVHLNNLWSVWYGVFGSGIQAYTVIKAVKRLLGYSFLYWPEDISLPYLELNCSLGLVGAAVLLLPIFLVCAVFKVGNLANDGFKMGRQIGMCSKEPPADVLTHGGKCSLFKHGGPTAPFVHLVIAFCLLLPKLLMEAKLIEAGFLSQEWIWKTDLDFMVVHRDRLVILSFMTSNGTNTSPSSISQARVVSATTKPSIGVFAPTAGIPLNHHPVAHTVIRTLKDLIGHENHTAYQAPRGDPELGYTLSLEFINLGIALMVYSIRYSAIFWSTNKCLGIIFSIQLLINSVHTLLSYCGMTILYKVQIAGIWKSLPLLKHTNYAMMPNRATPFLLNAQVTLGLYLLSTLLVVASSLILYFYGHTRFNEFLNRECQRKIISLKRDNVNKWSYFTHCAALCVLISVGICYAPLLHDYTFVYKGSLDDITLACIIGGILHLFLWVVIWLFLTIKQKWIFKLRVVVGRASVKQARSLRLITDVDLSRNSKDAPDQPLLVVANGRTYGVMDVSPQKAIMNIVKKSTTVRRAIHHDATPNMDEDEEQIYWLRPALSNQQQPSPDQAKQLCCFTKKEKQKVTFNDTASTSNNRCKINGSKTRRIPGMDEDDGDYATLRELPLPPINQINNNENDTVSEEGKLLACVHDENITYASTNQDLIPPLDYEDPSPLLTPDPLPNPPESSGLPLLMHNNSNASQSSTQNQTPRCLRRADSGMPHEEANSRSDSISTESSHSPPEAPESNHSESSSGVHSNDSREHKQTRRATSVVDLMQPPPREEVQWKSFSLQRNVLPPTNNNFNATSPPPLEKDGIPNVILEEGENTVIIRRKSCRPNMEVSQTTLETFGRATNMRMVSFTEKTDLSNLQSTSATLPHYPTQPLPNIYPNCSTMPLPPHNNIHTSNMGMGNSCNIYPRQHSTIPTHHNGVTVKMFNGTNGHHHQVSQNAHYAIHGNRLPCKQDLKNTDLIYSRIYRNPNAYHQSS